jgi:hypothetical protein
VWGGAPRKPALSEAEGSMPRLVLPRFALAVCYFTGSTNTAVP